MKKIERIKDRIIITLVFLVTIILAVLLLMSCEAKNPDGSIDAERSLEFSIVRVDSCEYIRYWKGIAHKGNCRYCAERNRRIIREQVDSILTDIYD
ncbi:MAG: hypothetical protein J5965_20205 [Aeriscardovia sp.]|nr:hypothetical protein [Aeriscardovia sp.]